MDEIKVTLEHATPDPLMVVCLEAKRTMFRNFDGIKEALRADNEAVPRRLMAMNHTSIFEHVVLRFGISGASRAFLAQVTRHRMVSFTSGSQHYQDHSGFDFVRPAGLKDRGKYANFMQVVDSYYQYLMDVEGLPREEARYVLPNACRNSLGVTINARSLANLLNLRLCNRNVWEMRLVAREMFHLARGHFPELFSLTLVGPDCLSSAMGCRQGRMACKAGTYMPPSEGGDHD